MDVRTYAPSTNSGICANREICTNASFVLTFVTVAQGLSLGDHSVTMEFCQGLWESVTMNIAKT